MRPDAMILVFWMLGFKPTFSLSSFTFINMLFSSSSLSAISVVSSTYLRLLIFLPAILIPAFAFFRGEHNPRLIILPSILEESKAILSIRSKATSVQSHDTADYVQSKGEKERYTHLNAEFQRIARRGKKGFLSDRCKEIEENNRWERLEIS